MVHYIVSFEYSAWGTWGHRTHIILNQEEYTAFDRCNRRYKKMFPYYPNNLECTKWARRGVECDDIYGNRCKFDYVTEIDGSPETIGNIDETLSDWYLYKKVMSWMKRIVPTFYRLTFTISGDDECEQDCILSLPEYRLFKKKGGRRCLFLDCGWKFSSREKFFHIEEEEKRSSDKDSDEEASDIDEEKYPDVVYPLLPNMPHTELDDEIHRWLQVEEEVVSE